MTSLSIQAVIFDMDGVANRILNPYGKGLNMKSYRHLACPSLLKRFNKPQGYVPINVSIIGITKVRSRLR